MSQTPDYRFSMVERTNRGGLHRIVASTTLLDFMHPLSKPFTQTERELNIICILFSLLALPSYGILALGRGGCGALCVPSTGILQTDQWNLSILYDEGGFCTMRLK